MSTFNPDKLFVEYRDGVTPTQPIIPRHYTLTHSDITAELFLTIGFRFAEDKITQMRDEVLGEWKLVNDHYVYHVYLEIDAQFNLPMASIRNAVFRRELPLALQAIRYGDRKFFRVHSFLDYSPILIHFNSTYPSLQTTEYWGTFAMYTYSPS
ncbi:staygreen family protein [Paenisporosarcina cavernae]|uniref:Staygreen protein domain-containing protein n=1 Tax=Paenisporosarcina cavernae TaxID=2320858 RepID=A0A385YP30_9BACL|nr:staygreen family protein [Paenisporosarcina cavernae]AYC28429.1 hypothetical protein D3873_00540 [Paenisporosarcina cavernae]